MCACTEFYGNLIVYQSSPLVQSTSPVQRLSTAENNRCYSDIVISEDALERLPENAVPPDLLMIEECADENPDATEANSNDSFSDLYTHSFLPSPAQQRTEDNTIRSIINGENPLDWPAIEGIANIRLHS